MRPERTTAAHKTDRLAELVCSNSFRSDDRDHNAVGLLPAGSKAGGEIHHRHRRKAGPEQWNGND